MTSPNMNEYYYLGEFFIIDDELSHHKLALFKTSFTSQTQFQICHEYLQTRKKLKHEHLIDLKSVEKIEKSTWCSTSYQLISTYEYIQNSLQKEILNRKAKSKHFASQELLRIAYDLIDVLAFLQKSEIINNSIVPSLIFLHDDFSLKISRAKIFERLNFTKSKRTNLISAITSNLDIYSDPEYYEWHFRSDETMNVKNPYKLNKKSSSF